MPERYVLVYNAGGTEVLHVKPLRHAIRMLHRGVAVVREAVPGRWFGCYELPSAIELVRYVYRRWVDFSRHDGTPAFSYAGVKRRDDHRCAYCGRAATTVDHVVPVSHGGRSTWLNCVAACAPCNGGKRDRTPEQAGMRLDTVPWEPTWSELYAPREPVARRRVPASG
ncbi:MAG: HNH endonuclease [Salana multivorans]|uniref:HNH endonuclease n=1 Tax=Salana multivorans TaxID=120377 RepID=UPI0009626BE7|nr:HNH endonuclease [Salana multivorans]MBN8883710.1 HNH endonuclease [Salana multivorans]OJX94221.1 MAG: hypothetical protein BGO96_14875 [Micrococcales bacterium 73-15]